MNRIENAKLISVLLVTAIAKSALAGATSAANDPNDLKDSNQAASTARELFVRANTLAKEMRWSEALADFQQSMAARPHAATAYNIGLCYRALGQYTRAHAAFEGALTRGREMNGELTPDLFEDADGYVAEIRGLLVHVRLDLEPLQVKVFVDGRPLERGKLGDEAVLLPGSRVPTGQDEAPDVRLALVLDPGTHLLVFSRPGYRDVLVRRNFAPGERAKMPLKLDSLPGRINITASAAGAVVWLDSLDEGVVPVTLSRPPGRYHVEVRHPAYLKYETDIVLQGGEETSFRANLQHQPHPITTRWWFWGAAAAVVAGAVTATVIATRPAPQRPPVDGGSLGWQVDLR